MLKFENNKTTIEGSGEQLLLEYAKLTNTLKTAIVSCDDQSDAEDYADYLLFTAFKGGIDAPLPNTKERSAENG